MDLSLHELSCVTCGCESYRERYTARLPDQNGLDFSARRAGQHYHPRIVQCENCGQVYSNPYFTNDVIVDLYRRAKYITEPQLDNMVADYLREFEIAVGSLPRETLRILKVGCATGFFLNALYEHGYRLLQGIEPGKDAVSLADPKIASFIRNEFFSPSSFAGDSFDIVCCFQVMDHMPNPASFLRTVYDTLKPGGLFLAINHDVKSFMTKLLGEKSPMYDIEHIFLFDQSTIQLLLTKNGFRVVHCKSVMNSYTLDYALKMFPLPNIFKVIVTKLLSATNLLHSSFRAPGGNMLTIGLKI